jgi:hypothetical protein
MARLYVVGFSEKDREASYLADLPISGYNPDSPSGHAPRAQSLIGPAQFAGERTNFSYEGHTVIYEYGHFRGAAFRLSTGHERTDRRKIHKFKFEKFEILKNRKTQKSKS